MQLLFGAIGFSIGRKNAFTIRYDNNIIHVYAARTSPKGVTLLYAVASINHSRSRTRRTHNRIKRHSTQRSRVFHPTTHSSLTERIGDPQPSTGFRFAHSSILRRQFYRFPRVFFSFPFFHSNILPRPLSHVLPNTL